MLRFYVIAGVVVLGLGVLLARWDAGAQALQRLGDAAVPFSGE